MNHHEEVPDSLGGLGETLPADVLKKVNELLEQLRQAGYDRHCSHIEIVLVSPGAQHVDNQFVFGTHPQPLPSGRGGEYELSKTLQIKKTYKIYEYKRTL